MKILFFISICLTSAYSQGGGYGYNNNPSGFQQTQPIFFTGGGNGQIQYPNTPDKQVTINVGGGGDAIDPNLAALLKDIDCNDLNKDPVTKEGQCGKLHSRCNFVAALNPFAKAQCCKPYYCKPSVLEGFIWVSFACTNIKEELGLNNKSEYIEERKEEIERRRKLCVQAGKLKY